MNSVIFLFEFEWLQPRQGVGAVQQWLSERKLLPKDLRKALDSFFLLVSWLIWKERNSRVFDKRLPPCRRGCCMPSIKLEADRWVAAGFKHYRRSALCRVPGGLPSVVFRALGKDVFVECFFWHSAKRLFAECFFLTLGKEPLYRVLFFYTRQRKFQSIFWSSKLIQMKKFSTTKLYNSSRCTMFVLVFSSYDKVKVNLFTNLTYLSCSLYKICEQC